MALYYYIEYAALLTPRSSTLIKSSTGLGEPMSGGLGAGRFLFLHKSLYYSFVHADGLSRPKFVQFVDPEGNVVEEQEVTTNNYQIETKKICGVWRKMPRVYRRLLKEEKLFAALVTEKIGADNDRFLAGRVAKQKYVVTELYSSLLEPATQVGTGGMAVISVSPSTGSIYLNVVFNGDFTEERDITITVRISDASGVGVEESVTIPKIQYESNSIEVRTILELSQLTSLSRGTLFVVVYSPKNPEFKLIGFIQSR
jgi:chordin